MQPQLVRHTLDSIKLPKQARALEENCITYLTDHASDAQVQANVWEIIRRNEFQNFLDKFVARGTVITALQCILLTRAKAGT